MIRILILLKSVDGGTGTYLEGLLGLKKLYPEGKLDIKVMVLQKPEFRTVNINSYSFLYKTKQDSHLKYQLNIYTFAALIKEAEWLNKSTDNFKPDIVIASDSHSILLSETLRFLFRKKYKTIDVIQNNLAKVIDYKIEKLARKFVTKILSLIFNRSDVLVSVSEYLSKDLQTRFNLRRLPVTISAILPKRTTQTNLIFSKPRKNILISVARFDKQKDYRTIIEAFGLVIKKIPNIELWLVGDGPQRKELETLVQKNKLSQSMKFLGWVQNPLNLLKKASVFILSSNWEGFPLTLLEAMTIGLPVIASDCDYGPKEIIKKNSYGLLFPVGDYKKLEIHIVTLLGNSNSWKHYSFRSLERSKDYSSASMLAKYKDLIDYLTSITVG